MTNKPDTCKNVEEKKFRWVLTEADVYLIESFHQIKIIQKRSVVSAGLKRTAYCTWITTGSVGHWQFWHPMFENDIVA